MVITIEGKSCENFDQVFESEVLKKRNQEFSSKEKIKFVFNSPTVHIFQKEYIVCQKDRMGDIHFVGSSEATTCAILCLYSKSTGTCLLCHLDSDKNQISQEVSSIVESTFKKDEILSCHVVGCYVEESDLSKKITFSILNFLEKNERSVEIETFMVMKFNSVLMEKNNPEEAEEYLPVFRNMCVDVRSGEAFPSVYPKYVEEFKKCPEYPSRCVRICNGNSKLFRIIYESNNLRICPFSFSRYYNEQSIRRLLQFNEDYILQNFSTSPNAESETFVTIMKLGYEFLLKFSRNTEYFKNENDNRIFVYEKDIGWKKIEE